MGTALLISIILLATLGVRKSLILANYIFGVGFVEESVFRGLVFIFLGHEIQP
ncbi:MAG: hypothetical protein QW141_07280 [Ignisphaera sp.]